MPQIAALPYTSLLPTRSILRSNRSPMILALSPFPSRSPHCPTARECLCRQTQFRFQTQCARRVHAAPNAPPFTTSFTTRVHVLYAMEGLVAVEATSCRNIARKQERGRSSPNDFGPATPISTSNASFPPEDLIDGYFTLRYLTPAWNTNPLRAAGTYSLRFTFVPQACIASPDGRFCLVHPKDQPVAVSPEVIVHATAALGKPYEYP